MARGRRRQLVRKLAGEQNHRCCYCGAPFSDDRPATFEHIIPKAHGGKVSWVNGAVAHGDCNARRGDMPLRKLRGTLKREGERHDG